MWKKILLSVIVACMFSANTFTTAQAAGPGIHRHSRQTYKAPPTPPGYNRYKFSSHRHTPYGNLRPGHAMPAYYHHNRNHYVIHDWQGYGLYAPPHGHQWLMVGGAFVLTAVATGIIAHILFGH